MSVVHYQDTYYTGYIGPVPSKKTHDYMIIEDRVHSIHEVIVHRLDLS